MHQKRYIDRSGYYRDTSAGLVTRTISVSNRSASIVETIVRNGSASPLRLRWRYPRFL